MNLIKRVLIVPEHQFIASIGSFNKYGPVRFTGFTAEVVRNAADNFVIKYMTANAGIQEFSYSTDDGGVIVDDANGERFVVLDVAWR